MPDSNTSNGVGFSSLLLIAFIVLKLCGVIGWSWLWVLSPLWIPIIIAMIVLVFYCVFFLLKEKARSKKPTTKTKWQERYDQMMENRRNKMMENRRNIS